MNIVLPDHSQKTLPEHASVFDLAQSISPALAKAALGGQVNGTLVDISCELHDGDEVTILTDKSKEALDLLRHSSAHVLAHALKDLYGDVKFGVGPAVEGGFYYDVELDHSISVDDLEHIEERMAQLVHDALPFKREVVSRDEALKLFADQPFKCELIRELPENETITTYTVGTFRDLCRGPHVPDTSKIGAFKLTKVAGAYWRGDAENKQLQRIYGTAFFKKRDLDSYLTTLAEAEKRDHRKLGKDLGIYMMSDMAGAGLPLYLPKGAQVIRILESWLRKELYARGYKEVITPHIYKADVWKTSGHYDFYHDNMYFFKVNEGTDEQPRYSEYGVKPMNCPGHVMLYANSIHSYKDLPVRFFEFGTVYRHEMSGAVHGLMRARGFTQDDAHLFCRKDQIVDEVAAILDLMDTVMSEFGFTYEAEISTRPEKSIGSDAMWERAETALKKACELRKLPYEINEGDGAFYGPKIDIKVRDAIGRMWQCSTVQVDFNLPERFNITYRSADNTEERPFMLHRALFGSIERFLGILIEHYAGALPLWLAPTQVVILPIADRHKQAAHDIAKQLTDHGGRVEVYEQNEPMRIKIAKAQTSKVPYMIVLGDKELETNTISVRERSEGDLGSWPVEKLAAILQAAQK